MFRFRLFYRVLQSLRYNRTLCRAKLQQISNIDKYLQQKLPVYERNARSGFADYPIRLEAGTTLRANVYKCGDDLPVPHFISWSPIHPPSPASINPLSSVKSSSGSPHLTAKPPHPIRIDCLIFHKIWRTCQSRMAFFKLQNRNRLWQSEEVGPMTTRR